MTQQAVEQAIGTDAEQGQDRSMARLAEILRENGIEAHSYEGHRIKLADCDNYPVPDRSGSSPVPAQAG